MKNKKPLFAITFLIVFLFLTCLILAALVRLAYANDNQLADTAPMFCEAIQQPDGTIVDRPCAVGENPVNGTTQQRKIRYLRAAHTRCGPLNNRSQYLH